MTNQEKINDLKEKIHDIKEYINSGACQICLSLIDSLKEYQNDLKTLQEKENK